MTGLLLGSGAILLVVGAELLVRGASRIAAAAGITPLVIGLTVVAFGTSAPELAVSLGATLADSPGIAVGNVVGSNIFNVLFILGISALIVPLAVQRQLVRLDVPVMIGASIVLLLLAADGMISRIEGGLLFTTLVGYTVFLIRQGGAASEARIAGPAGPAGANAGTTAPAGPAATPPSRARALVTAAALALVGLVLLVSGSRFFVDGAVALARTLGVSEVVVGLTIIAAGTSLPEVATSVLASIRGERDLAVGNVVGSNIFNLLGILGICAVAAPDGLAVEASFRSFDIPIMVVVALAALPIFFTGFRISRFEGVLFIGYYAAYTTYLILRATEHDALANYGSIMLLFVVPLTALTLLVLTIQAVRRGRSP